MVLGDEWELGSPSHVSCGIVASEVFEYIENGIILLGIITGKKIKIPQNELPIQYCWS